MTLVVMDPHVCPDCGSCLHVTGTAQLPLLRHGGYGAARQFTVRYCLACSYSLLIEVTETRP